ncbi:MAG: hypothetical protein RLZZ61_864 [Pseudomonadota bacterium]
MKTGFGPRQSHRTGCGLTSLRPCKRDQVQRVAGIAAPPLSHATPRGCHDDRRERAVRPVSPHGAMSFRRFFDVIDSI